HGPFDGVFGFSQGAALAALLMGMSALAGQPPLACAMIVGGFATGGATHAPLYAALRADARPTLHVVGRRDGIVPPERSRALAACFGRAQVVEHDGGHVVAATPQVVAAARALLLSVAEPLVSPTQQPPAATLAANDPRPSPRSFVT